MSYNGLLKLAEIFSKAADRKDYMRQYMANRYHSKMHALRNELGNKCKMCGDKKGPFHIDHIDSSKKTMRAADVHSTSDSKVEKEKKNLQLLCNPCHKKKTHDDWDYAAPKPRHGTYWQYRKHGCRCEQCVKAYKAKLKEWRQKRKGSK